jgi:homoserine dehydrogenase
LDPPTVFPVDESRARHYLRLNLLDQPGTLAQVTGVLSKHNISISAMLQKDQNGGDYLPVIILTHEARERELTAALREIAALDVSGPTMVRMMVEDPV